MNNILKYNSPIGILILVSDGKNLINICFEKADCIGNFKEDKILMQIKNWLDRYFKGENISIDKLKIDFLGTPFQNEVWKILCEIQYGKTMTYGEIADIIAKKRGIKKMSAQAVGRAVGSNPIPIIIPCHRVIGKNSKLIGYSGGIDKKIKLLELEGHSKCFLIKK